LGGRLVGFIVFDLLYRHFLLITATVGGTFIGWGLDLTDRTAAWIVGSCGAAVGALLGVAMWLAGPGRKIGQLQLWVIGSAFFLVWWFLALAVCVAIQKLLVLATGGWDVTPLGALLGGAIGLLIGGVTEELWWHWRRRHASSARTGPEQGRTANRPRD
jgi:hypothetical protein